jgi:hypothetical protein
VLRLLGFEKELIGRFGLEEEARQAEVPESRERKKNREDAKSAKRLSLEKTAPLSTVRGHILFG